MTARFKTNVTNITYFDDLNTKPRWVMWCEEIREAKNGKAQKPTKVPYSAMRDGKASSTNPDTWATRDKCNHAWKRVKARNPDTRGGVGVVLGDLGDGTHLMGLDLDGCRNSKKIAPWAKQILDRFESYTEVS